MSSIKTSESVLAGSCTRRGRFWEVTDADGQLVCLAVYKKGAQEVLRRLGIPEAAAATGTKILLVQRGEGR